MPGIKILLFSLVLSFTLNSIADNSTYNAVATGKECEEDKNQSISCAYKIGDSLLIEIAGIGSRDTGIAFLKSDYKDKYYGKYGLMHGCIIINSTTNFASFAFISPKNGKVYHTWQECAKGM